MFRWHVQRTIVPSRVQPCSNLFRIATKQLHQRAIHISAAFLDNNRPSHGFRSISAKHQNHNRVLIVGGGPTGLFLAHLLRSFKIPFRLIEAQTPEQRFKHPQAHFLNTRTMEILKYGLSYNRSENSDQSNEIYEQVRNAMPPVKEWNSFRFGPDMTCSAENGTIMADVIHPVERPLASESDANGKLVLEKADGEKDAAEVHGEKGNNIELSSEAVGHLAQHKFCQSLYDALTTTPDQDGTNLKIPSNDDSDSSILYGHCVTGFEWNEETRQWTVKTDSDEVFEDVEIILAADGAASTIRKKLFNHDATTACGKDSTMLGTPNLQRLINVHFEIPSESRSCEDKLQKDQQRIPPAMLYTIFNPDVLAMVVRHSPGEYVLQIPYFEPYQTPEEDFSIEKVRKMVRSILGKAVTDTSDEFIIHSIRPWTMGSLVAKNYYTNEGVFLVGDAAHVFPPAGGFGMNTGLQDAYSLVWRIALKYHQEKQYQKKELFNTEESGSLQSPSTVGRVYERERQPVARRNAALSVRNYRRVLNVMRACYLDDRHPALLIKALDATAPFVSLETRQKIFRSMLQNALLPLTQLQKSPNGVYAKAVKDNLRILLRRGGGLPLLFPRYELDFSYDESNRLEEENEIDDWSLDSTSSSPKLAPGILFPHITATVPFEILERFPRLQPIENNGRVINADDGRSKISSDETSRKVSTRDLAAQLATSQTPMAFCLLEIVVSTDNNIDGEAIVDETLPSLQKTLKETLNIPVLMSRLVVYGKYDEDRMQFDQSNSKEEANNNICQMHIDNHQWEALNIPPLAEQTDSRSPSYVVIRPDGHVAAISSKGPHAVHLISGVQASLT